MRIWPLVHMRRLVARPHGSFQRYIPFSHVWGCNWPRSGHVGLVTRRRRGTSLARHAHMAPISCESAGGQGTEHTVFAPARASGPPFKAPAPFRAPTPPRTPIYTS